MARHFALLALALVAFAGAISIAEAHSYPDWSNSCEAIFTPSGGPYYYQARDRCNRCKQLPATGDRVGTNSLTLRETCLRFVYDVRTNDQKLGDLSTIIYATIGAPKGGSRTLITATDMKKAIIKFATGTPAWVAANCLLYIAPADLQYQWYCQQAPFTNAYP